MCKDRNGQQESQSNTSYYKEYTYDDGKVLRLTREDFDRVVEVFQMLLIEANKKRNSK